MAAIAKLPMYIKRDWVAACTQRLLPVADQYTLSLPRPCNWVVTIIDRAQLPSLSTALQQWTLVTCHHMICGILPTIAPFLWNSCSTLWKSLQCGTATAWCSCGGPKCRRCSLTLGCTPLWLWLIAASIGAPPGNVQGTGLSTWPSITGCNTGMEGPGW